MRKVPGLLLLLATASCQGGEEGTTPQQDYSSNAASDEAGPPGIEPTAAPGVAFNYRYAFRLPAAKISPVQEEHAAACEKLGVTRCRITAMHYERRDEEDIQAQLGFKLDPALARAFGKQGIDAVTRAEGELAQADITGTDVGSEIAAGARGEAQLREELERIERQLAGSGRGSAERAQLQQQAQDLRNTLRVGQAEQTGRREQLASTPVTFDYRAGHTHGRLREAVEDAGDNFVGALTVLLIVLVTLLPWAVALFLLWLGARWINRRFLGGGRANMAAAAEPEAPAGS
jgi:Domain of unknown function (DUF4349)